MAQAPEYPTIGEASTASIIALDLGQRTGWASFRGGLEHHRDSGVFELYESTTSRKRAPASFDDGQRFRALAQFLNDIDQVAAPTIVAFEQVNGGTKGRQTQLYNGYRAILMEWCYRCGKRVLPLPVGTIKKLFTGTGSADKERVIAECVSRGYLPFDDNEADAIAILHAVGDAATDRALFASALSEARASNDFDSIRSKAPEKKKSPTKKKVPGTKVAKKPAKRAVTPRSSKKPAPSGARKVKRA